MHTRRVTHDEPTRLSGLRVSETALLLDVDGTIAPIVGDAADASVPVEVKRTLVEMGRGFGLLGCVSGRTAEDAKRVVGVAAITYIGCHGSEVLMPGMVEADVDPQLDLWADPVNELAIEAMRELSPIGVRREEKGAIAALHWRGASDEYSAREGLSRIADEAIRRGLAIHWGRKVLELRTPVPFDKGRAIESLISGRINRGQVLTTVIYAGDDSTDLDAFAAIDRMLAAGMIERGVKVAVVSDEGPPALAESADLRVDGPEGMAELLESLLLEPGD